MPLYTFQCIDCGDREDVKCSISAYDGLDLGGVRMCTVCNGRMYRKYTPLAVLFRGSGWASKE
jgi:predicted nucleic acid-binding Zn ribbon protein